MWAETGTGSFHIDRIFGRVKQVYITLDSDGTNLTLNAAQSSPNVTGSGVAAGVNVTFEPGTSAFWSMPIASGTTTVTGRISASSVTAGTATFVISAAPSAGGKLFITFHVGRTG